MAGIPGCFCLSCTKAVASPAFSKNSLSTVRACATADCASCESLTVCSFVAFSSCRIFVASAMAASRLATPWLSSAMSSPSLAMEDSSSSTSAWSVSTASLFSLRVCSFVASSVSHQPLCSASSFASSTRRTRRSLIIFLTLRKGSAATRPASAESTRLLSSLALTRRYSAARVWVWPARSDRRAAREVFVPFALRARVCVSAGKCFSALPDTALLLIILSASLIALISSMRSFCLVWKSVAFCSHVATKSS
mmetsp:Transcript_24589/g.75971  ORF Transcript_24589/g.75971 Transcript_24589/m.75971 type:complete len:252 (+) Transcript_24589:500-1255(+)